MVRQRVCCNAGVAQPLRAAQRRRSWYYRRVTKTLQHDGWTDNHKRVLRVMRQETLLCQPKRRFVVITDSVRGLQTYPNLFVGFAPTGPDQLSVADFTYIWLLTAFVCLACVLDGWSRRCFGSCRAGSPPN